MSEFNVMTLIALYKDCADSLVITEGQPTKVDLVKYSACMRELLKVFDGLGKAFSFAFSDLNDKTKHIEDVCAKDKANNDIQVLAKQDEDAGNKIPDDKTLANMRALNRMAFVSLFIQEIFQRLASDPNQAQMKPILQESYSLTMELYHTWLVKKAVGAAFLAAPTRASFMESVHVTEDQLQLTPDYCANSQKIVDAIKANFEALGLKWVFQ